MLVSGLAVRGLGRWRTVEAKRAAGWLPVTYIPAPPFPLQPVPASYTSGIFLICTPFSDCGPVCCPLGLLACSIAKPVSSTAMASDDEAEFLDNLEDFDGYPYTLITCSEKKHLLDAYLQHFKEKCESLFQESTEYDRVPIRDFGDFDDGKNRPQSDGES